MSGIMAVCIFTVVIASLCEGGEDGEACFLTMIGATMVWAHIVHHGMTALVVYGIPVMLAVVGVAAVKKMMVSSTCMAAAVLWYNTAVRLFL